MTTQRTQLPSEGPRTSPPRTAAGRVWTWIPVLLGVAAVVAIGWNARNTPAPRVGNPAVAGKPERPVHILFGFDHWLAALQIGTLIVVVGLIVGFVIAWRRHPGHPILLMALVTTFIVWQDPIMNWSPFAVYDPRLWHFPESWPLVSISPSVEPFIVLGYVLFQLGPYFPGIWILRRIQARVSPSSFVWRHPLISLAVLIFVIGFLLDAFLEITLIHAGLYIYSQVIPWGSVFTGTTHQFPLVWESAGVTLVMIPAGVLLYRDDTGRTVAEKLAQKVRLLPTRPVWGMFTVMFIIVNIAYLIYGGGFLIAKDTKISTSVACPWPYPDAKVYDPQGFYEKNGQPGPYSVGIMSTWMSAEPHGRPHVQLPVNGGRCSQAHHG